MSGDELKRLIEMVGEMSSAISVLTRHQQQFIADLAGLREEQQHAAKALAEAGAILERHAHVIVQITDHLGLGVVEESSPRQQPN